MLVNSADVLLKAIILLKVTCVLDDVGGGGGGGDDNEEEYEVEGDDGDGLLLERTCYLVSKLKCAQESANRLALTLLFPFQVDPEGFVGLLAWLTTAVALNVLLGLVTWWRCYANNFLHWGALATWLLLLVQGEST